MVGTLTLRGTRGAREGRKQRLVKVSQRFLSETVAPHRLDGFSNRRYEEKRESFDLLAMKFESGVIRVLGEKSLQHWSPFKTWIPPLSFYYTEQSTANSNSFKIAKNTAFKAKG